MERQKKKRMAVRGATSKLIKKIDRDLQAATVNSDTLEEYLIELKRKESELIRLDEEIGDAIDEEHLDTEFQEVEEYRERITMWKTRLERRLRKERSCETSESGETSSTGKASNGFHTLKLPRLTIDKFYGDASGWQNFWAQFTSAIHENEQLSKIDKFNYLKCFLGGVAANAIAGLSITESSYDSAIKILSDRFGRRDLVISAHMNKLLNIPPVRKSSDVISLRKLFDSCEIQVRSLESMGVVSESYSSLLCPILMKVIPEDIVLEFNRSRRQDEDWQVTELLKLLKLEIESRERTLQLCRPLEPDINKNRTPADSGHAKMQRKDYKPGTPSAIALNATAENGCIFCNRSDHETENCTAHNVDGKRSILVRNGRCFLCLKRNHMVRMCKSRRRCSRCSRRHHHSICQNTSEESTENSNTVLASFSHNDRARAVIYLQTAQVIAKGRHSNTLVRCLIDSGCQRTFIKQTISAKLGLPTTGFEALKIHAFGSNKPSNTTRRRVRLSLHSTKNSNGEITIEAVEAPEISGALIHFPSDEILKASEELGIQLADDVSEQHAAPTQITIVIGADYYWDIVTGKTRRISGSLVAVETIFGWTLHGPTATSALAVCNSTAVMKVIIEPSSLNEEQLASYQLRKFWELESIGITDNQEQVHSNDDEVLELFKTNIRAQNGRYEVSLPWKPGTKETLANNRVVAEKRLDSLVKRFRNHPVFFKQYEQVIAEYLAKGIIEDVPEVEKTLSDRPVFYLPHRAVIRDDKNTTKVRVVFDASSCQRGETSLNECLFSGPNLNPDLFELLVKFRQNRIAFVADIEKAFLQIELSKNDRDAARFLWIDDPLSLEGFKEIRELRLTRVLFGVTSSPFLLAGTIKHHLQQWQKEFPEACNLLNECLYVDDLVGGANDEKSAFKLSIESARVMNGAGMCLRKWHTNSSTLRNLWEQHQLETEELNTNLIENIIPLKVLGLAWNQERDNFYFDVTSLLQFLMTRESTKRFILRASGRIFDPVGFLTPYVVRVKCLFQKIWTKGVGWDEPLPHEVCREWDDWCDELKELKQIAIPRFYLENIEEDQVREIQLHSFADASTKAYGAVLYLRTTTKSGSVFTSFVCSKSRVAPLKALTLPRLELMAALIAARLSQRIRKCLKFDVKCHFWTDSKVVLYWIRGYSSRFKPFVGNRVNEIQLNSAPSEWAHCPGLDNPADMLSRGARISSLSKSTAWWNGPRWLVEHEECWPRTTQESETPKDEDLELRARNRDVTQNVCAIQDSVMLLNIDNYSSLSRLLRVTAWIRRFVFNCRHSDKIKNKFLDAEEVRDAETFWIKTAQMTSFSKEIEMLTKKETLPKDCKISNLNPFIDENGVLRVGGRISLSEFTANEIHPILLHEQSRLTELIIQREHNNVMHSSVAATLARIRRQFWILKGRQLVKRVLKRCLICNKFSAKPTVQVTAPLPKDRLLEAPPFSITGLDYCGPIITKDGKAAESKAYVALFTCAVTRAVHLELVTDLKTDTFILALRRFIARRGVCRVIYSDNAKTFKCADKELKDIRILSRDNKIQNYVGNQGITWKYIVERAAWWGGFWERLVRSVKTCLRKILGRALLKFEELTTLLAEVEAVLNSRPLTYVCNDLQEPEALTPSHFLLGGNSVLNHPEFLQNISKEHTPGKLTKRMKYRQTVMKRLWRKWKSEYLLELRSAHYSTKTAGGINLKKNDIVLFEGQAKSKLLWTLGIIEEVYPGRDGRIRACAVRTPGGKSLRRPVQLLYPLEVRKDLQEESSKIRK